MTYHYSIPAIPPSLNEFAGRENAWDYRELKKQWTRDICLVCHVGRRPPEPMPKARVTLTYYFPSRRRHDPDNYAGKLIMDGLTAAGVIKDDSFDCVELVLRGGYDPKFPRTEIEVEPVMQMQMAAEWDGR